MLKRLAILFLILSLLVPSALSEVMADSVDVPVDGVDVELSGEESFEDSFPAASWSAEGLSGDSIVLNENSTIVLDKGISAKIEVPDVKAKSFKSSNTKITKVSQKGVLTTVAYGKATVTVTLSNKKKRKLTVVVDDPNGPEEVKIIEYIDDETGETVYFDNAATAIPGIEGQFTVDVFPEGATKSVTWKSSNKKVVSIDKSGNFLCIKPGTATVTATTHNGKTCSLKITVQKNKFVYTDYIPSLYEMEDEYGMEFDYDYGFWVKSIEAVSHDKLVVQLVLVNETPYTYKKINKITVKLFGRYYYDDLEEQDEYHLMAQGNFSNIKLNVKPYSKKTIKLTFSKGMVIDPVWWMDTDEFDWDLEIPGIQY